jgi:hypothetical protein
MEKAREDAEAAQCNVDERICTADATLDPY